MVSRGVGSDMRQTTTTPSLHSPHDATTDQSALTWKTNATHNVILDHRFVMTSVVCGVAEGGIEMETLYVMGILKPGPFFPDECGRQVEESCLTRFPCKSKDVVSIPMRYFCDGIFHCDDHSDE